MCAQAAKAVQPVRLACRSRQQCVPWTHTPDRMVIFAENWIPRFIQRAAKIPKGSQMQSTQNGEEGKEGKEGKESDLVESILFG